ncbi:hypothetical protein ACJ72_02917 [Emergomyces africanus]|uniref:Uncharacterized protein n=1 Tax=Emergomyces africanus TaxID=1955775 RepID=A0A1B7P149_9EURO|nr:hypothetical protein ACJ72_02917 [Emergomyces africanus]
MKLPVEIRYKIYDFLLESIRRSDYEDLPEMKGSNGFFPLNTGTKRTCARRMEDLFELYKAIREGTADAAQVKRGGYLRLTAQFDVSRDIDEMTAVSTSDEGGDEDEDEDDHHYYDSDKGAEEHDEILMKMNDLPPHGEDSFGPSCHPTCGLEVYKGPDTAYCVWTPIQLQAHPCYNHLYKERTKVDFNFLSPLFYVSREFTRDIGACLWRSAIIKFETPECFFSFIAPRPAILKFLKCIELELQYYDDWFDTSSDTVVAICQFISKYMDLRYVRIDLVTNAECLEKILEEGKLERWKTAFTELKVSHGFDLRVVDLPVHYWHQSRYVRPWTVSPLEQRLKKLWHPSALVGRS